MINQPIQTNFDIPVLLSEGDRHLATTFANQQPTKQKAQQIYHNTLAVCAVKRYLRILGFTPDLSESDSWNPLMRLTMNVADLMVSDYGRLECRVVLADEITQPAPMGYVPSEVHDDRLGYLMVFLNETATEAWLLGFVESVSEELLPLSQLRSLAEFPNYLEQVRQKNDQVETLGDRLVHIDQWFQNQLDPGWQRLHEILVPQQLTHQWRTTNILATEQLETPQSRLTRAKVLTLDSSDQQEQVLLIVDVSMQDNQEFHLELHVCPVGDQDYLPNALDMKILDELGDSVMQAQTRAQNRSVELSFSAEPGDRFSLKLYWNGVTVTECFVV